MDLPALFGSMVFNDAVMKARLPKDVYQSLQQTRASGKPLDFNIASAVACAMKDWAIEKGATHYTHWFQPMNGYTAEKHDSFIMPAEGGGVIMEFSGKELVKGEPDASSLPSGGLRATFEARGYTAWDPTSFAFIKENTLCIPTAFCSYSGAALDHKTPLLRSTEALDKQAVRIIRLFGGKSQHVMAMVGAEQEYFLVDESVYNARPDLMVCGRTLFGAKPPKGQELDDHYFGSIKPRIARFMHELDEELWKLGVYAKTEHNETAPAQHELAPVFTDANTASDQNHLMMEMMKVVANRLGLACLLHEKPFDSINGSGKHNNWSINTDDGVNLLKPGDTPSENAQFLLFLTAVIRAVDEYQDLLRFAIASAGNDHRLGAKEAPPAIVSVSVGSELSEIIDALEKGESHEDRKKQRMSLGVTVLPKVSQDTTDRNRTSPFAFTGNKFELRMLGSSSSVAAANIVLNTIVAESLREFADYLEGCEDFHAGLNDLVVREVKAHKRIIFNGNNYSEEWQREAKQRGLHNLATTVDAATAFLDERNIELFTGLGVFTEAEIHSQYEIMLENYAKTIRIEGLTMADMVKKGVIPSVISYENDVAVAARNKRQFDPSLSLTLEESVLARLSEVSEEMSARFDELEWTLGEYDVGADALEKAMYCRDKILPAMNALRVPVDTAEELVGSRYWEYPTYTEILNSVK